MINKSSEKNTNSPELRCHNCHKLLGIANIISLSVSIKCHRCGDVNNLSIVFNNALVIITDKKGVILSANDFVENITGYLPKDVIGKKPNLWGSLMTKSFYKTMWETIAIQKKAIVVKVRNKSKSGVLFFALLKISPILDDNGDIECFLGIETKIDKL